MPSTASSSLTAIRGAVSRHSRRACAVVVVVVVVVWSSLWHARAVVRRVCAVQAHVAYKRARVCVCMCVCVCARGWLRVGAYICGQTKSRSHPRVTDRWAACVRAVTVEVTTASAEASPNPLLTQLFTAENAFQDMMSDIQNTVWVVIVCGIVLAAVLGVAATLTIGTMVKCVVWTAAFCAIAFALAFTLYSYARAGIIGARRLSPPPQQRQQQGASESNLLPQTRPQSSVP